MTFMSDAERQALLGKTMEEHAAVRAELALLQRKAANLAGRLIQAADCLQRAPGATPCTIEDLPTAEAVKALIVSIDEAATTREHLAQALGQMGFRPAG